MAILQLVNAVFYHPLDDLDENLQSHPWQGSSTVFDSGLGIAKIGNALVGVNLTDELVSGTPGPKVSFEAAAGASTSVIHVDIARIDETRVIVVYSDKGESNAGQARVGIIDSVAEPLNILFGSEVTFSTDAIGISVDALSTSTVVVTYGDDSRTGQGTAQVGTVSGTDLTWGAKIDFNTTATPTDLTSVAAMDSLKFAVCWMGAGEAGSRVGIVAGTDITYGAKVDFDPGFGGASKSLSVAGCATTMFVVAWQNSSDRGQTISAEVTGTTITYGAAVGFGVDTVQSVSTASLSMTKFVVGFRSVGADRGRVIVGTVSDTTVISLGDEAELDGSTDSILDVAVGTLDSEHVVIIHSDGQIGKVRTGRIVGSRIFVSDAVDVTTSSDSPLFLSATCVDRNHAVVAYEDGSDGDGIANVVSMDFQTALETVDELSVGTSDPSFVTALDSRRFLVTRLASGPALKFRVGTVGNDSTLSFGPEDQELGFNDFGPPVALDPSKVAIVLNSTGGVPTLMTIEITASDSAVVLSTKALSGAGAASLMATAALSSNTVVAVWNDNVRIASIVGNDITLGATVTWSAGAGSLAVAAISSTHFVIADGNTTGRVRIGTVAGTTISLGAEATYTTVGDAAGKFSVGIAVLDSTNFVMSYGETTNLAVVRAFTVSGSTISLGAPRTVITAANTSVNTMVATLDSSRFVFVGRNTTTTPASVPAVVGTVSDAGIAISKSLVAIDDASLSDSDVATLDEATVIVVSRGASNTLSALVKAKTDTVINGPLPSGPFTFPTSAVGQVAHMSTTALSATKVLVCYGSGNFVTGFGKSRVADISGSTVDFGPEADFRATAITSVSAVTLTTSQAVVCYTTRLDQDGELFAKGGVVSGNTISWDTFEKQISPGGQADIVSAVPLDSTKFIACYRNTAGTSQGWANIGTVVGIDNITVGATSQFNGGTTPAIKVVKLGSAVVVCYGDSGSSNGRSAVGTISGSTSTWGPSVNFVANLVMTDNTHLAADSLDSSSFIICYAEGVSKEGRSRVGVVSGNVITLGAETTFSETTPNDLPHIAVAGFSATRAVVFYEYVPTSSEGGRMNQAIISSDLIAQWGPFVPYEESENLEFHNSTTVLSPTRAFLFYTRETADDQAVGVTIQSNSYPTAVGATRTAFSAWIKRPLATVASINTLNRFVSATEGANDISMGKLDSTRFIVAYRDGADSSHGTAKIGTITGTDVTFGPETEFLSADGAQFNSVVVLDSSTFVVCYRDTSDFNRGKAKVGTVSGTDVTFGPETTFRSSDTTRIATAKLTATTFITIWRDDAGDFNGASKIGVVTGTTVSFGALSSFATGGASFANELDIAALSSTRVLVVYRDQGGSEDTIIKVGTVSGLGTSFSFGPSATLKVGGSNLNKIAVLDSTRFVVCYSDLGAADRGKARFGTVSGVNMTFGTEETFEFDSLANGGIGVAVFSPTSFIVCYDTNAVIAAGKGPGRAVMCTTTGTTGLSFSDSQVLNYSGIGGTNGSPAVETFGVSTFAVCFRDAASPLPGYGTTEVGTVARS